eukprot:IDg7407t1
MTTNIKAVAVQNDELPAVNGAAAPPILMEDSFTVKEDLIAHCNVAFEAKHLLNFCCTKRLSSAEVKAQYQLSVEPCHDDGYNLGGSISSGIYRDITEMIPQEVNKAIGRHAVVQCECIMREMEHLRSRATNVEPFKDFSDYCEADFSLLALWREPHFLVPVRIQLLYAGFGLLAYAVDLLNGMDLLWNNIYLLLLY